MDKLKIYGALLAVAFSASALAQAAPPAEAEEPEVTTVPIGKISAIGRGEEASLFARGELVLGQLGHGTTQGVFLCILARCSDPRAMAGAALLGAALGGGGAFLATWNGISAGPAEAINNGTAWGIADGLFLWSILGLDGDAATATMMLSALAGTGVGLGAGLLLHPSSGQVAMVNSAGMWTGGLIAAFVLPFWTPFSPQGFFTLELVATHLAMVGFSVLAGYVDMDRGRMFLIDAGGVIGALLGLTSLFFFTPGDPRAFGPIIGTTTLLGLGTVAFFSQGLQAPKGAPKVSLMPMVTERGGFGLMAGAIF